MSALFDFQGLLVVMLLSICTCSYLRPRFGNFLQPKVLQFAWKRLVTQVHDRVVLLEAHASIGVSIGYLLHEESIRAVYHEFELLAGWGSETSL